jgi:hypothetical protein
MSFPLSKSARIASWIGQLVAAAILGMASLFKLTSAPDSIAVFQQLGAEPWGRYAVGLYEAVTTVLLLVPGTAALGGLMAAGLMVGAIGSHLIRLGITINGDPSLFMMAVTTLIAGLVIVTIRRAELPVVGRRMALRTG